jgi:hypothetical protein
MPRKTKKSSGTPAQIRLARSEYAAAKRQYHKIGKQAAGARAGSAIKREYREIKRDYHQLGKQLGSLTGRKPRRK